MFFSFLALRNRPLRGLAASCAARGRAHAQKGSGGRKREKEGRERERREEREREVLQCFFFPIAHRRFFSFLSSLSSLLSLSFSPLLLSKNRTRTTSVTYLVRRRPAEREGALHDFFRWKKAVKGGVFSFLSFRASSSISKGSEEKNKNVAAPAPSTSISHSVKERASERKRFAFFLSLFVLRFPQQPWPPRPRRPRSRWRRRTCPRLSTMTTTRKTR